MSARSGDRPDRDERPDRDRGDSGDDRSLYRSGPRIGGRDPFRPDQRDDRFGRGSWQDRGERGRDRDDAGPGEGFASPVLLAEDEELVAGRRPVAEAFTARRPAKRLLVVPERRQALEQLVLHATALRIPVVEVEGGTLTSVSGFDGHQGIALVVEPRRWATLDDVLARAAERGEPPLILVLDSLEDPQNVGTLLRTAEANGVHGVIFPTRRSAPISPAAIKTSAGATEHLLLVPLDDLAGGLVDLRSRGLRVVGADEEAQLSYRDADLRGPLAIVVGSEGTGHLRRRASAAGPGRAHPHARQDRVAQRRGGRFGAPVRGGLPARNARRPIAVPWRTARRPVCWPLRQLQMPRLPMRLRPKTWSRPTQRHPSRSGAGR